MTICPKFRLATFLFLLIAAAPAVCQTNEPPITKTNRSVGISFEPSWISYREYANGALLDSERGWVLGAGVDGSLLGDSLRIKNLLLSFSYDFNTGSSNHWSESLIGGSPLSYAAPFTSNDISFGIGKGFLPTSKLLLGPQVGFEYREWVRKLPEALLAIREDYTFWAPGAAVSASYNPVHAMVLKARLGAEYTVSPTNATIGNPAAIIDNQVTQVPNLTFSLGNRPVWRAELEVDEPITPRIYAFANIDYSHFSFGQSATAYFSVGGGHTGTEYEPSSVTDLIKLRVGLAWCF